MNRFSDEIRIISGLAWVIACVLSGGLFCLLMFVTAHDPKLGRWPEFGQIAFCLAPTFVLFAIVMLIGYVNADARRRGMRHVLWTLLAIFLPNTIGIILYFVLRDPLPLNCGKCGAQGRLGFAFCPQCGAELANSCPACKRTVESGWNRCAYCGSGLSAGSAALKAAVAKS